MPHAPTATAEHLSLLQNLRDETDLLEAGAQPVDAPYLRLTTTGTTGTPKRVDLTEQQIAFSADASAKRLGFSGEDRWLCCLPLHHIAGLSILFRTARMGATTVLHPNFDPHRVSKSIDEDNIQLVSLVPTMLKRILDVREGRPFPASLRVILLGGAPCPPSFSFSSRAARCSRQSSGFLLCMKTSHSPQLWRCRHWSTTSHSTDGNLFVKEIRKVLRYVGKV